MKKVIIILSIVLIPLRLDAAPLSPQQIERVKEAKNLLGPVEPRTTEEIVNELTAARFSEENLQILEAVAQTYRDMLIEYKEATNGKREWLHSVILLNVAFFQFGGSSEQNDTGLNIVIRRKLKKYLSPQLLSNRNLFYALEDTVGNP